MRKTSETENPFASPEGTQATEKDSDLSNKEVKKSSGLLMFFLILMICIVLFIASMIPAVES